MKYIFLIGFWILNISAWAQLHCVNYYVKDGLPSENITAIAEDAEGYIYIGTSMGLSYFDGVSFRTISDEGEGDQPNNLFIEEIRFDSKSNVWISTEHNGLYRMDIQKNRWSNFSKEASSGFKIPNNTIWDIEIVHDKVLLACEDNGIIIIDIHSLEVSKYVNLQDETITDINASVEGSLLLTTHQSIFRVDSFPSKELPLLLYESETKIGFTKSFISSDGYIYLISYQYGVFQFGGGVLSSVMQPEALDTWRYNYINEYDGKHWLTLKNYGLASVDFNANQWKIYQSEPFSNNTLPKGKYNTGFKDSRDILWIGTSKGLSSINPNLQAFENFDNEEPINEFLLEANYDRERNQYVMIFASEKNKVKIFDDDFNIISSFNHTPDVKYIQSLFDLIPYESNYFCLGHDLMFIQGKPGEISKANLVDLPQLNIPRALTIDDEDNLWICHEGNKVLKYSLRRGELDTEIVLPNLNDYSEEFMKVISMNDCGEYISIAAKDIFLMIHKTTYQIKYYDIEKSNKSINKIDEYPLQTGSINSVLYYEDSYYICSRDEGVYRADFSDATSDFTVTSSLLPNELYGPVELVMDDQKEIWIATDNGLAITDQYLNIKKKIKAQDGLPYTKLSQGLSLANGKLILNNGTGITVADTSLLKKSNKLYPVDIKSVKVNNERIDIDTTINLRPSEKNIEIYVSMPLYDNRSDYKYAYRLLPINEAWNEVNISNGKFRFDNLEANDYSFEIKLVLGSKSGKISKFAFVINRPYWKTWWFLLLVSIAILCIATLIYTARVKYKVNQEKVKTQLAELQNEAIRAQLNPHFIFNALNSIRSLILTDNKEHSLNYLVEFSTLVREVLSISKEQSISLKRELDFNANYVNIEKLRFSQPLNYEVTVAKDINTNSVKVPPLIMQPFIENAIWHGLLGKVDHAVLRVDIMKNHDSLYITIDDNGTGRIKKVNNKSEGYKMKKPYGELLSNQRLQSMGKDAEIKIVDKLITENKVGTKVIIKLPLQLWKK